MKQNERKSAWRKVFINDVCVWAADTITLMLMPCYLKEDFLQKEL